MFVFYNMTEYELFEGEHLVTNDDEGEFTHFPYVGYECCYLHLCGTMAFFSSLQWIHVILRLYSDRERHSKRIYAVCERVRCTMQSSPNNYKSTLDTLKTCGNAFHSED